LNLLFGNLTILTAIGFGIWGLYTYFNGRKAELRNREEERFEGVVKYLGSEHIEERINASVLLSTFLSPVYKRFHEQVFNLAAGHLRTEGSDRGAAATVMKLELPATISKLELTAGPPISSRTFSLTSETGNIIVPGAAAAPPSNVPSSPPSPSPIAQALANVLSKSYELCHDAVLHKGQEDVALFTRQFLNAAGVRLDGTHLATVNLRGAWLRQASLRGTTLSGAILTQAVCEDSDMSGALLIQAELLGANLKNVNFTGADLTGAALDRATLDGANFTRAVLKRVNMRGGTAADVDFTEADLTGAVFDGVNFSPTNPLTGPTDPLGKAKSLENAEFRNCEGLPPPSVSHLQEGHLLVPPSVSHPLESVSHLPRSVSHPLDTERNITPPRAK
jgi:uncharacterized protein YjbI with pentapeptide repeats